MTKTNRTQCPHCGDDCRTIKTNQIAPTYREITYLCPTCSYTFVASVTPVRSLAPSDSPNPDIKIPFAAQAT